MTDESLKENINNIYNKNNHLSYPQLCHRFKVKIEFDDLDDMYECLIRHQTIKLQTDFCNKQKQWNISLFLENDSFNGIESLIEKIQSFNPSFTLIIESLTGNGKPYSIKKFHKCNVTDISSNLDYSKSDAQYYKICINSNNIETKLFDQKLWDKRSNLMKTPSELELHGS